MSRLFYSEKDSSEIYEELSLEDEDYQEEEERSSDPMSEMISKYGNY